MARAFAHPELLTMKRGQHTVIRACRSTVNSAVRYLMGTTDRTFTVRKVGTDKFAVYRLPAKDIPEPHYTRRGRKMKPEVRAAKVSERKTHARKQERKAVVREARKAKPIRNDSRALRNMLA